MAQRGVEFQERYQEHRTIGRGAQGEVKLVTRKTDGKQFAVKIFELAGAGHSEDAFMVRREVRKRHCARVCLQSCHFLGLQCDLMKEMYHRNIVEAEEIWMDDNRHVYIVMEYIEGTDLAHEIGLRQEPRRCDAPCLLLEARFAHDSSVLMQTI